MAKLSVGCSLKQKRCAYPKGCCNVCPKNSQCADRCHNSADKCGQAKHKKEG